MKSITLITLIISLNSFSFNAKGQTYLGAFEVSDMSLYYVSAPEGEIASMNPIQQFKNEGEPASVASAIGALYSQQYQRVMAVYSNESGEVIAHSARLIENQSIDPKETFGVCKDLNYRSWFAVVLSKEDEIIAIRVSY